MHPVRRVRNPEHLTVGVRVDGDNDVVVGDVISTPIRLADGVPVEIDHEGTRESLVPIGIFHPGGIGAEPLDLAHFRAAAPP